jgi:hypothetical protein
MHGMQGAQETARLSSSVTLLRPFPFDHVEATLKSLSYKKVPDPEVNYIFEVGDTATSGDKYLLEFTEDGIRIYKEDCIDVSFYLSNVAFSAKFLNKIPQQIKSPY